MLFEAAPTSKVLVYTTVDDLTEEKQYEIFDKGAYFDCCDMPSFS